MSCCSSNIKIKASPDQALTGQMEKPVTLSYGNRQIRAGFHITEAKASAITSLDCGSNRHNWNETIIQLLDIDGPEDGRMSASKFVHILEKAGLRLEDAQAGQIIFEIGGPDEAMQLYDFAGMQVGADHVEIKTLPRLAMCKPIAARPSATKNMGCCGKPYQPDSMCCA